MATLLSRFFYNLVLKKQKTICQGKWFSLVIFSYHNICRLSVKTGTDSHIFD